MSVKNWFSVVIPCLNEERTITEVIKSLYNQTYRPIEVLIVDGGSTDQTKKLVQRCKQKFENQEFQIELIDERLFNGKKGPSKARNVGLKVLKGKYVVFIDADWKFSDEKSIEKFVYELQDYPVVNFKLKPIFENDLEHNLALDANPRNYPTQNAFRKEAIKDVSFDQNLGFGEDWDFINSCKKQGLLQKVKYINTEITIHSPQTLNEYLRQRFWRGRTVWPLIKKHPTLRVILTRLILPISSSLSLMFSLFYISINIQMSLFFLILFLATFTYLFLRSPVKNAKRAFHLVTVRLIIGSFTLLLGSLFGLYQTFFKKDYSVGRDQ